MRFTQYNQTVKINENLIINHIKNTQRNLNGIYKLWTKIRQNN